MTRKTIGDSRYDDNVDVVAGLMIGAALLYAAFTIAAFAQEGPAVPDERTKVCALKRAYELNGGSMVGNGYMIDVSKEDLSKCLNPPAAALEPKKPVKKAKATK
jgi:hypothetical protein